jgi:hypothetical protein
MYSALKLEISPVAIALLISVPHYVKYRSSLDCSVGVNSSPSLTTIETFADSMAAGSESQRSGTE